MYAIKLRYKDGREGWLSVSGELSHREDDALWFESAKDVTAYTATLLTDGLCEMNVLEFDEPARKPYRDRLIGEGKAFVVERYEDGWAVTPESTKDEAEARAYAELLVSLSKDYGPACGAYYPYCLHHLEQASGLKLEHGIPSGHEDSVVGRIY